MFLRIIEMAGHPSHMYHVIGKVLQHAVNEIPKIGGGGVFFGNSMHNVFVDLVDNCLTINVNNGGASAPGDSLSESTHLSPIAGLDRPT
jgi:hypothetical protein